MVLGSGFSGSDSASGFSDLGSGKSVGTMPFQLCGNIEQSGLVETAAAMRTVELRPQLAAPLPCKNERVRAHPYMVHLPQRPLSYPIDPLQSSQLDRKSQRYPTHREHSWLQSAK